MGKMEITRAHFRAMIFYDFNCGLTQQESLDRLRSAFGDGAPTQSTVYGWFAKFKRGHTSLNDEFREGRPRTAVVPENIDAVRNMIETEPQATYRAIQATIGIDMKQIHEILHEHLAVKKHDGRWIPK